MDHHDYQYQKRELEKESESDDSGDRRDSKGTQSCGKNEKNLLCGYIYIGRMLCG